MLEVLHNPLGVIVQSIHSVLWLDERASIIGADSAVSEPDLKRLVEHSQVIRRLLERCARHLLHMYFKGTLNDPAANSGRLNSTFYLSNKAV